MSLRIRLVDAVTGAVSWLQGSGGAALVSTAGAQLAVDTRFFTFDAAADMPVWSAVPATWLANVGADRIKIDNISATAQRVQVIFHHEDGQTTCRSCCVTVNADDDATANTRLAFADVTGGATSSSGSVDTIMVSPSHAMQEFNVEGLTRLDLIGIPGRAVSGVAVVEVRIIG